MSYITFKTIGAAGDLGSQLTQYACLLAVAKENNKKIIFPQSSLYEGYGFKFANLVDVDIVIYPEDFFDDFIDIRPNDLVQIDPRLFDLDKDKNYNIVNRFDSFQYFHSKCQQEILDLSWNMDAWANAYQEYNKLPFANREFVSIHVRRGDYMLPQHDHFCKLDTEYYSEALQPFLKEKDKYHFVVFSNDIEWCKENLIEGSMVTFIEPGKDVVDLMMMSMCDHNIIANSSFSWWAAYKNFNVNKIVVCPQNYLKAYSPWAKAINKNYYPSEWISINNK
jgi:hypothetical protein